MNGHMLRTSAMGQPPAMLGMGNASFMQNPGQMNPQSMVMPPNMSSNPPMNMLGPVNGSIPNNPQNQQHQQQRMLMQQHQQAQLANQQQQQRLMRPGQGPQGLMAPGNGQVPAPHMAGLNPQMGHPFAPGMPQAQGQNPALRRVPSQTQMGMNNGVVSGGMSLPQSQPQSAHMRQLTQMRAAQHQQHQQQLMQQQAQMLRQVGGSTMPPSMSGVGPSQNPVMSSLSQPSIGQQHNAMGLGQNQMQHPFANGVGMSNSQPPHGLSSSSPRPPNGMGMASGPSQAGPRASMTPDNANAMSFINYPGTQFSPGGQRMSGATQQYPFAPASTPPVSDMSDQSRGAFPTPAQQLQMNSSAGSMNSATDPFAGPSFAQPMAPRASQHNNNMQPHPIHTPQLSQRQTPQPTSQSHNTPQPGPSAVLHHSPIHTSNPSDHLPMQPSRPQSRPQSQPQISHNQAASPHGQTPRSGQVPLPPGATIAVPGRGGQQPPPPPTNIPPPPQSQQRPPLQQQHTGGQPPTPGGSQPEQFIGNRPPTMGAPAPPPPTTGPTTLPSGRPAPITSPMLGNGQGLLRMLQFSGILSSENKSKLQLAWWNELVKEYFTPKAVTKITLWKDNAQVEAKPFEIGIPVLPRFFLVTTQSGVKSMTFNLDGARERMVGTGHAIIECVNAIWTYKYTNGYTITLRGPFTIHMVVTAMHPPTGNGAQPGYMLKIDEWQFSATHHDKMISLDSIAGPRNYEMPADMPRPVPTPPPGSTAATLWAEREAARQWDDPMVVVERATMPSEPINAFGIPQATMRCLELAESVGAMADLISFADETKLGPLAALTKFADILRSKGVILDRSENPRHTTGLVPLPPLPDLPIIYATPNPPPPPSAQQQQMPQMGQQQPPQFTPPSNGIIPPPQQQHTPLSNTLYQSAPSSITNPQHHPLQSNGSQTIIPPPPGSATMSPQNTSSSASNSPQKSHRAIPNGTNNGSSGASGSSPAMSASGSTSHNTPNMANASLKRKQAGAEGAGSPVLANGEGPPTKRATRKRNRTNTAG